MTKVTDVCPETDNNILAVMSPDARTRIGSALEFIRLALGEILYESRQVVTHVYFPTTSIVSIYHLMNGGASVETAVVGNDGFVGIAAIMGGLSTSSRALVQSAGYAYRLPADTIRDEFSRHGSVLRVMLRYTQALMTQMAQTAVCTRHHSIEQQVCRVLLILLDRVPGNQLKITQVLIARMLGVRRESVSEAAGRLRRKRVIDYARGTITILNRPHLEALCCECYVVVRKETDRLLPYPSALKQTDAADAARWCLATPDASSAGVYRQ